jgi:hypothetical protein
LAAGGFLLSKETTARTKRMKNFPLSHEGGEMEEKNLGPSGEGVDLPPQF